MQMSENGNQELCGEQLEELEQIYSSLGGSAINISSSFFIILVYC
tara:strand:- start:224 stop:358 length:135 start_codon:yes stop_codon:yes gene_type:complete